MPKKFVNIAPFALFVIIVCFLFWQALFPPPGQMLFGDDIDKWAYFYTSYLKQSLTEGVLPFWNPYQFSGIPFAQAFHSGLWYPPRWALLAAPPQYGFAWFIALHVLLAMSSMYVVLRRWVEPLPATSAAIAYGLSGQIVAQIWAGHNEVVAAMSTVPIVMWAFERSVNRHSARSVVLLTAAITLQFVSGYPILSLFTLIILGFSSLILSLWKKSLLPLFSTGCAALLALVVLSVQLLPNAEYLSHTVRSFPLSYAWLSTGALEVNHVAEFISPFIYGDQYTYFGPWQYYHERIGYIGIIPLVTSIMMVILAFIRVHRNPFVWVFIVVSLFGIWVSLAYNAPLDINRLLYEYVPMYKSIRIPTRHLFLFIFGMCALSAFGINELRNKKVQLVLLALVVFDGVIFAQHFIRLSALPTNRHDSRLIQTLKNQKDLVRFVPNFNIGAPPRDALDFASPTHYRVFSATGYDPSMLRNYFEFISAMSGLREPSIKDYDVQVPYFNLVSPFLNFLNVKYILVPPWQDQIGNAIPECFTLLREDPERLYRWYENKRVLPRFYFVEEAIALASRNDIYNAIYSGNYGNVANTILVDKSQLPTAFPLKSECAPQKMPTLGIVSYGANRIELDTDGSCGAVLVTSEVYYPGWKAYLDGKETQVVEGNLAFRALFVPEGVKRIVFEYDPYTTRVGAAISIIGILVCILLIYLERLWQGNRGRQSRP